MNYPSGVLFLNTMVDFLLLTAANRLTGCRWGWGRCALASVLGGIYAALCLLPAFERLGSPLGWLTAMGLLCVTAFGVSRNSLRRSLAFFLLSMAMGGMASAVGRGETLPLMVCGGLLWGLCTLGFGTAGGQTTHLLKLTLRDRTVSLLALEDTGNCLRDSITGEGVVIIGPEAACRLTGLTRDQLCMPLQTISQQCFPGLRLIPYHSIGAAGFLLGLRIQDGELDGKKKSLLVALAPEGLGKGEGYQALTGGVL